VPNATRHHVLRGAYSHGVPREFPDEGLIKTRLGGHRQALRNPTVSGMTRWRIPKTTRFDETNPIFVNHDFIPDARPSRPGSGSIA